MNILSVIIAEDLATIRAFYERICALALDVNSAFGKVVFAWYIKIVLSICVDVTQLFRYNINENVGRKNLLKEKKRLNFD